MTTSNAAKLCLTTTELDRFHSGELPERDRARAMRHLEHCTACRNRDRELIRAQERIQSQIRELWKSGDLPALAMERPREAPTAPAVFLGK